jgi:2-keto-3-deoxy-6-phosphogluconate aldolase
MFVIGFAGIYPGNQTVKVMVAARKLGAQQLQLFPSTLT